MEWKRIKKFTAIHYGNGKGGTNSMEWSAITGGGLLKDDDV
jgi:hypothetical protein